MHRALGTRSAVCRAEHSLVLHCLNTGGTGARRHLPREALAAVCQADSQVLGCGGLCARLCTRRPLRPRRAPGVRARGAGCGRARGRALRGRRHAARCCLLRRAARPGGLWRGRGTAPGRARCLAGRQARPAALTRQSAVQQSAGSRKRPMRGGRSLAGVLCAGRVPPATLRSPPAMRGTDVKRAAGQGRPRAHRAALGGRERPVRGGGGAAGGGGRRGGRAGGGRRRRRRAWRSAPRSAAGDAGATSSRLAACGPRVSPTLTGSVSTASAYVVAASLAQTLGAALTSSEGTLDTLGTPLIFRYETRRAPGARPRRTSQQMRRSTWRAARAAPMRPLYVPRMQASMHAPHARRTSRATRRCTWRRARAMRRPCARCWRARAARRPRWRAATAPASCRCTRQRARGRGRPRPHWRPPRRRPRRSPTGAA